MYNIKKGINNMDNKIHFVVELDLHSKTPLYIQLYDYIKKEIIAGNFKAGYKLPSIREGSTLLNISKTTIENTYNQLIVEGYIDNLPKKGYFINEITSYNYSKDFTVSKEGEIKHTITEQPFVNSGVDRDSFDTVLWKKLYNRVFNYELTNIYVNGQVEGEYELRREISEFVNNLRDGKTNPNQVIIGAGIQYLIGILIGILGETHKTVAIEENGYNKAAYIFEDYNYNVDFLSTDSEDTFIGNLFKSEAKLLYVSPSHQYPYGQVMTITQRMKLLNWANTVGGLIIEDDYDGIIRYDGKAISCLQGLDNSDSVIYLGSFSKTLLPSLRISYMIIPNKLIDAYNKIKYKYTQSTSKIDQIVLSIFIGDGHMTRHLRKIRKIYKKKSTFIANYLSSKYNQIINVINLSSGFHIIFEAKTNKASDVIINLCKKNNIFIEVVKNSPCNMLLSLNYSGLPYNDIPNTMDTLVEILK